MLDDSRSLALAVAAWEDLLFRNDTDHASALAERSVEVAASATGLDRSSRAFLHAFASIQLFQAGRIDRAAELAEPYVPSDVSRLTPSGAMWLLCSAGVVLRPKDLDRSTQLLERRTGEPARR